MQRGHFLSFSRRRSSHRIFHKGHVLRQAQLFLRVLSVAGSFMPNQRFKPTLLRRAA